MSITANEPIVRDAMIICSVFLWKTASCKQKPKNEKTKMEKIGVKTEQKKEM